ncbi:MAG: amidase [Pseudomonadota bacterium]
MQNSNLLIQSATELAAGLRAKRYTSRQLVDAHIERIEQVNPVINAVVACRYEQARSEADAADAKLAQGRDALPPFHGVPCTIKENFAFAGMPHTAGLMARRHEVATSDAPAVARLRAAGAIPLGVTNTPELCMWMETHNQIYGRTNNSYNPRRIAGGSSGGEGAIIGAGASPFGLGADVGGSIRMPAFFNGIFGHKPSPGLVPNTGQFPLVQGEVGRYCVTGPLARRAEDLWPLMKILAGPDGIDQVCTETLSGDSADVDLSRLRVFAMADNRWQNISRDMYNAHCRAADSLAKNARESHWISQSKLRHSFEIWSAMLEAAQPTPFGVDLGGGKRVSAITELIKLGFGRSAHTLPALALALAERVPMPRRYLQLGLKLRDELIELIGADGVLLVPTYPRVAPRHRWPMLRPFDFAYCGIFNVLGFPVTQVPMGLNDEGLPLGVQVVGIPGNDHLTIAIAMELERQHGGWVPPWTTIK